MHNIVVFTEMFWKNYAVRAWRKYCYNFCACIPCTRKKTCKGSKLVFLSRQKRPGFFWSRSMSPLPSSFRLTCFLKTFSQRLKVTIEDYVYDSKVQLNKYLVTYIFKIQKAYLSFCLNSAKKTQWPRPPRPFGSGIMYCNLLQKFRITVNNLWWFHRTTTTKAK